MKISSNSIPDYETYLSHVLSMAERLPRSTLAVRLDDLIQTDAFPPQTESDWQRWVDTLQQLMQTERNLFPDIELTTEEFEQLVKYLEASKFLRDCLAVAVVSKREEILGWVLRLPPGHGEG